MATELAPVWQPDWAVPPGDVLLEVLEERGMTQSELARRTDRPVKTINEIVKGKAAITVETAIQFERALGVSARFWNNLETNYREAIARQESRRELEKEGAWADRFPLKELARYGLIRRQASKAETVSEILAFFRVSSRSAWEKQWQGPRAAFRASPASHSSPEAVAAWLRWGEIQASSVACAPFNSGGFRDLMGAGRRLTELEPISAALEELAHSCAQYGVALVVTPELPGAPLSGATRWIASNKVLIQLSLRYKSDDQLWFSLFHEAGHVLLPQRRQDFVDALEGGSGDRGAEDAADEFARDELIPPDEYRALIRAESFTENAIRAFGRRVGVAPGIVVARLQHDGFLGRASLNGLKRRIRLTSPPPRSLI